MHYQMDRESEDTHDGSDFILEDVRYVPGLRRSLISLGTLEKEGYTVKMQMGRIKVIKGFWVIMTEIRKKNCVYTLEAKVMTFGVQKHGDSKQVRFKQLGPGVETGVHGVQVSNDDAAVAQRRLEDKQLEEKTNTNCLVKEKEKVHLGIKVGANIMVTEVPGQEGANGNVAEKKKVKESIEANLGKLLKYNTWSTRWSPVREKKYLESSNDDDGNAFDADVNDIELFHMLLKVRNYDPLLKTIQEFISLIDKYNNLEDVIDIKDDV
ncbi:hypothetical protein Tco_1015896 [Tanacetum coccineum]|uniref:Retrovirus-related Pol polyprotein from transposon TNT 1-94-like beta-barrel domain-containing protein n=1 Tax=Tanacetum coccineum TaxID=301880 RepID=A0ABQ5FM35_9ASTR